MTKNVITLKNLPFFGFGHPSWNEWAAMGIHPFNDQSRRGGPVNF